MLFTATLVAVAALACHHVTRVVPGAARHLDARVPLVPPDSYPRALFDSLGFVSGAPLRADDRYRKDIIVVEFVLGTPLAARQAAIDSVGGTVVGGALYSERTDDGTYYVRIQGGTPEALLHAVMTLKRQPQVTLAAWWAMNLPNDQSYRRP